MDSRLRPLRTAVESPADVLCHEPVRYGLTRKIVTAPEQEFPFNAYADPARYAQYARHYA